MALTNIGKSLILQSTALKVGRILAPEVTFSAAC
jgi:hypothetical protein